ncbi:homoserine dehydrogenase [Gammaproteobacteria bacterium]|nr:homoserine dehydrogenase [Gammaproteobacteria bacterium]
MNQVKIGILGLGTVGGGVVNVLSKNHQEISRRCGSDISIEIAAVKDLKQKRICSTDGFKLTENSNDVVNHPDVEVVLELIGGTSIAKDLTEKALKNKKHVITANKALIAKHGNELLKLAKDNSVSILFEASVAGGIPILKSLGQGLTANKIDLVAGIINGTGNFIMTEMKEKGRDFDDVLMEAQALGYAEADPTFDIEGIDAAHKLAILTSIAFGVELNFEEVSTEGISQVDPEDISIADELGYIIKHLGVAKKINGLIDTRVHPTLIPKKRLLANVNGVMNAVLIKGNAVGPTLYYGPGAGDEATASAVIADLVDLVKGTHSNDEFSWKQLERANYIEKDNVESIFYLRILASDKPGVLADITSILAKHNISVESVVQKQIDPDNNAHIAIITNKILTKEMNKAINEIQAHDYITGTVKIIPVETLD